MNRSKVLAFLLLCAVGYVALNPLLYKQLTQVFANTAKASSILTSDSIAAGPTGDYSVVGKPTISAAHIDTILQLAHSPATGTGAELYSLGVRYGIDPIFALAFFQHESSFGTNGWGATNKSLGNIRCSQGYSCAGGYRAYGSWQVGYQDWYQLIANLYIKERKLVTVAQIVPVYAPSSENNPLEYIHAVESAVDTWR